MKIPVCILIFLVFFVRDSPAQEIGNIRVKSISLSGDTLKLDTLSIIPGTFRVIGPSVTSDDYQVDFIKSEIIWLNTNRNIEDSILVSYRVFPVLFTKESKLRDRNLMTQGGRSTADPFLIEKPSETGNSLFGLEGLNRSGSISRGITIGSNQDAVVNSSLNLQLSGKLAGDIEILAAITDDNIPIQAEGNTQQLQEFDKVFIQLSNAKHRLIAGDFEARNPESYFMRYYKKGQGGLYNFTLPVKGKDSTYFSGLASAAVSKGRFARNTFNGIESNQGPYRLRGAENESFIIILSGSEKIFLDGILLDRGQDRDYIIDYNTSELTFTTRRIITKDSRIVAEFQYSDKNYARTLLTTGAEWKQRGLRTSVNFYSEQDSKNQPVQQDLTSEEKALLAAAGDNLFQAYAPNIDSVAFNPNEILYAQKDTIVNGITYPSILVYSTNPDSAKFRAGFTNVGPNNGHYNILDGNTNGRTFYWVAPVDGVPQGQYEPKILLVTPKQRQMLTASADVDLSSKYKMGVEFAGSRDDQNLFSNIDKEDDIGAAVMLKLQRVAAVQKDSVKKWTFSSGLQAEISDKNFRPVENYRSVEFTRDWNSSVLLEPANELLSALSFALLHPDKGEIKYAFRTYLKEGQYQGIMNSAGTLYKTKSFRLQADGSYLITQGDVINSSYIRHREDISYVKGTFIPGLKFEQEQNEIELPGTDSLALNSFSFRVAEAYLQRPDTVKLPFRLSVSRRYDDVVRGASFREATVADMGSFMISAGKSTRKITANVNYRNLHVSDNTVSSVQEEETVSGRLEYVFSSFKNSLQLNGFYEAGTGREPRKVYSYVQVAAGTGVYTWNDYNGDAIPQLNEFEVAAYQDEADYIRVFTPTDDYIRVYFNQFNAVINFTPAAFYAGKTSKPWITKFAIQSALRFDNRISAADKFAGWNPFPGSIADSTLLVTQNSGRHTLYFDRNNAKFSSDITWQDQQSRQLLSNGIETRTTDALSATIRWNFSKWLGIQTSGETGNRISRSEAFTNRDYDIQRYNIQEKLNIQPGTTYRFTFSYRYENKENLIGDLNEKADIQEGGIEWRYSTVKQGIINLKFSLVSIRYNGAADTPIAYEMLEGLKTGTNPTWGLSMQRNLGNSLQVSINYEGRKPSGIPVIHSGGAQVRAFF